MPIHVITDRQPAHRPARARRGAGSLLGGAFLLAGLAASVPAFVLVLYAVFSLVASGELFSGIGDATRERLTVLLVSTGLLAAFGPFIGIHLMRGRRVLVLFLRRFGYTETTEAVTAAARSIGRFWRLVTLDDAEIAPIGVGAARSINAIARGVDSTSKAWKAIRHGLGRLTGLVFVGALGTAAYAYHQSGELDALIEPSGSTAVRLFQVLVVLLAALLALTACLALLPLLQLAALPFAVPAMFVSSVVGSVRAADNAKAGVIRNLRELEPTARAIVKQSRRILAPRLIVLRVETAVWRAVVGRLVAASRIVLVDVSEPTENLLWEIEELRRKANVRCVFICHHHKLPALLGADGGYAPWAVQRLRALLDGTDVLAYAVDPAGVRRFTHALRAAFEAVDKGAGRA
ncbi:hypothetical protein [Flindersiella endophytica]